MNLHEYQARELLRHAGIPVPPGEVATTAAEAKAAAERLGSGKVVVKAQVHAGGRGKAGGVKLADTPQQAAEVAGRILGMKIKGLTVEKVLVAPAADIKSEAYVGVIVDRASQSPVMMVSPAGGIDIEEVAAKTPEKIFKTPVDARYGLLTHQAMALAFRLYDDIALVRQAAPILQKLYRAFVDAGASLAEINPLVVTPQREVVALDAKIVVDDNELERKPAIEALRDVASENPFEVQAREANLTYIKLDGNVGCIVNGAGLAMATMDLVKYYGGEPANFLDIGTVNDPQRVVNALKVIIEDPSVKAILVNIFGGMARVDIIAQGVIDAHKQINVRVPVVMRLVGTNLAEGEKLIQESGLPVIRASGLAEAAKKAVEAAGAR